MQKLKFKTHGIKNSHMHQSVHDSSLPKPSTVVGTGLVPVLLLVRMQRVFLQPLPQVS